MRMCVGGRGGGGGGGGVKIWRFKWKCNLPSPDNECIFVYAKCCHPLKIKSLLTY